VRRSMATMLVTLGALSTPLAAQEPGETVPIDRRGGAFGIGLAATIGSQWQMEGAEIGYVWQRGNGMIGAITAGARLGAFVDEGAILGGTRGFVFGASFGVRSGVAKFAEIGDDLNLTSLGFDITLEGTGYVGANSPLPQGSPWAGIAVLPGFRILSSNGTRYGIMAGATLFMGRETDVRAMIALRVDTPLARRGAHP
jgi:hypothetical protein